MLQGTKKVLTTFYLILIFDELFKLKLRTNGYIERRRTLLSTFILRSHRDPIAFFTALPRVPDQKIRMQCCLILLKLHQTRKIFF